MNYNLIVVGAGPAGMMAAGRAAENGAKVLLLERRNRLGVKLGITGNGRCNITNAEFDNRKLITKYGKNGKFLFSAFSSFGPSAVIEFFESRGLKTKIEREDRVFPASDKSFAVIQVLKNYLKKTGVKIKYEATVQEIRFKNKRIEKIILANGEEFTADYYCLATGGRSYPVTGSTGDGYEWAKRLGHKVNLPRPALVPIIVKEKWIRELEGLSLKETSVSFWQNNKKQAEGQGEILFTANGMSGPIILNMSKTAGELLARGGVKMMIDFQPALNERELDLKIQKIFHESHNKMLKNVLDKLLPQKLISVIIKSSAILPEKKVSEITREERKKLWQLLKSFTLNIDSLEGFDRAIITSGGVDISEIDPKTCRSKIVNNLFFAGEIIDLDGPTGGFNLQIAWSTGFVAGESVCLSCHLD